MMKATTDKPAIHPRRLTNRAVRDEGEEAEEGERLVLGEREPAGAPRSMSPSSSSPAAAVVILPDSAASSSREGEESRVADATTVDEEEREERRRRWEEAEELMAAAAGMRDLVAPSKVSRPVSLAVVTNRASV